jgi:hypothetical protein
MNRKKFFMTVLLMAAVFMAGPAMAHDTDLGSWEMSALGVTARLDFEHSDQYDWKGAVNVIVTNTGNEAWGDFHFSIFDARGIDSSSVVFTDALGLNRSSRGDQGIIGGPHSLDFYFYDHPVYAGESIGFTVYTDNTSQKLSWFGIGFYPTPVPLPGTLLLLCSGMLPILGIVRRKPD